jgi:hypothetical protein
VEMQGLYCYGKKLGCFNYCMTEVIYQEQQETCCRWIWEDLVMLAHFKGI